MDVSRIGLGKISLHTNLIAVQVAIASAIESVRPLIDAQNHHLAVEMPDEPVEIEGDLGRLAQVFTNLLNNAAKYTPRGGRISISLSREGPRAVIRVRDSGIGIAADHISQIFELFAQVDQSLERGAGGLGVGLSLAKTLVELHGGEITVQSNGLGEGSEFAVSLPIAVPLDAQSSDRDAQLANASGDVQHLRIVVADDNVDSAMVLADILRGLGHDVRTAHDGQAALDTIENFQPDVALLDIGMPKLSGYEVATRTRALNDGAHRIVMVAVTGWGQEHDRQQAREAGFDHHLTKPLDLPVLNQLLAGIQPIP
jgi:CheY-like chemotaxis protein